MRLNDWADTYNLSNYQKIIMWLSKRAQTTLEFTLCLVFLIMMVMISFLIFKWAGESLTRRQLAYEATKSGAVPSADFYTTPSADLSLNFHTKSQWFLTNTAEHSEPDFCENLCDTFYGTACQNSAPPVSSCQPATMWVYCDNRNSIAKPGTELDTAYAYECW